MTKTELNKASQTWEKILAEPNNTKVRMMRWAKLGTSLQAKAELNNSPGNNMAS